MSILAAATEGASDDTVRTALILTAGSVVVGVVAAIASIWVAIITTRSRRENTTDHGVVTQRLDALSERVDATNTRLDDTNTRLDDVTSHMGNLTNAVWSFLGRAMAVAPKKGDTDAASG